jgi:lysophospholipase L1-like esterase
MASTSAQALTIMGVGDSITEGDFSTDGAGWRSYLQDMLAANGVSYDFYGTLSGGPTLTPGGNTFLPEHSGYGGQRILDVNNLLISDAAFPAPVGRVPDVVLLMVGTNNATSNLSFGAHHPGQYIDLLEDIYNGAPGVHIIVSSLLPIIWDGVTSPDPNLWVADANNFILNDLMSESINFGSGGTLSTLDMVAATGINTALHFADDKHPNDLGYQLLAGAWFDAIGAAGFTIPEPGTLAILGLGIPFVLRRRRAA